MAFEGQNSFCPFLFGSRIDLLLRLEKGVAPRLTF